MCPPAEQHVPRQLGAGAGGRVDDPGARKLRRGRFELPAPVGGGGEAMDGQLDQRAVEVADDHVGLSQAQAP